MPGGELHQFKNTGQAALQFLCMIPHASMSCDPADPNCCAGQPEKCTPVNVARK